MARQFCECGRAMVAVDYGVNECPLCDWGEEVEYDTDPEGEPIDPDFLDDVADANYDPYAGCEVDDCYSADMLHPDF